MHKHLPLVVAFLFYFCHFCHYTEVLEEPQLINNDPVHFENELQETVEVLVHRTTIRVDLVMAFKNPEILKYCIKFSVINANGKKEKGTGEGVTRDVLSTFWQEFYTVLSIGSKEKSPIIRHEYQKMEWEAIARLLVYGYKAVGYFPLQLSHIFMSTCLFGDDHLTRPALLDSFHSYITSEDREIFDKCVSNDFDPTNEEIIEFLSNWNCHRLPTKDNIQDILYELAHQELIQKPRYIANCWGPILSILKVDPAFQTIERLTNLYDCKRPSARKILRMIDAETENDSQRRALDHLKRYVRSLEGNTLKKFLHFVTGSDVIVCDKITVEFTSLDGFNRRPIVHTCGPMIELPTTYDSYTDLAEEFNNIMREDKSWSFHIA